MASQSAMYGLRLHFGDVTVEYQLYRLPVIPHRIGIIKQDLEELADTGMSITVQARKLNDTPKIGPKGDTYIVSDAWVNYMRKLMTQKAWDWWIVAEYMLMINRPSKWGGGKPTQMPAFECIALPCNFIASDAQTATHARVVSRDSQNFDTSQLDSRKDNWFYAPHQFWKATAHNDNGEVFLVGASLHVYTPVIREEPEQWIERGFVEWFPTLPMTVTYQGKQHTITGYALKGASVYGHAEEMDIPLRLARTAGELIHPCPEWRLIEKPVPPEVRPEWK